MARSRSAPRLSAAELIAHIKDVFTTPIGTAAKDGYNTEYNLGEIVAELSRELVAVTDADIIAFMNQVDEPITLTDLIVPLLRHIGFEKVQEDKHRDRRLEFGQDIRTMRLRLPTGHALYLVAQLKKGAIKSSTGAPTHDVMAIINQLEKALDKTVFDYDTNTHIRPDHAYLIATGQITKDARLFLEEHISSEKRRRVMYLDGDDILELCRKNGLPLECQIKIRQTLASAIG